MKELDELIKKIEVFAPLLGRIFLAALFLWSGYGKLTGWQHTAGYMAAAGMPLIPFFEVMAVIFEIGGGLMLLFGFKARLGGLALAAFLIPTTPIFHRFWSSPEEQQMIQLIMWMKNTAIIGGLLMVARFGAGEFSIDNLPAKKSGS